MKKTRTMTRMRQRRERLTIEMNVNNAFSYDDGTMQHNLPVRPTTPTILHHESNNEDVLQ